MVSRPLSFCRAHIYIPRTYFVFSLTTEGSFAVGLPLWREGVSIIYSYASFWPCQNNHSRVQIPQSPRWILLSRLRLAQPEGSAKLRKTTVYIVKKHVRNYLAVLYSYLIVKRTMQVASVLDCGLSYRGPRKFHFLVYVSAYVTARS